MTRDDDLPLSPWAHTLDSQTGRARKRCDQCDNRVIKGWGFCAYCGWPLTDEGLEKAQREISERIQAKEIISKFSRAISLMRCEDCPPVGYPVDTTRCATCPRWGCMFELAPSEPCVPGGTSNSCAICGVISEKPARRVS